MTDGIITSGWDLVNELWGNAPYGNVWVKHRDGTTSTWFAISGEVKGVAGALPLARFNAETARLAQRVGADVYFGVHPVSAIPPEPGARTQAAIVHSARCLFGDFDRKDYAGIETNEALAAKIVADTWQAPPSVMVDTGGGIHAYWLLEHREDLTDAVARAEYAALQARWVRAVGADKGAKDLARVLRLPGTLNQKYTPAPTVKIIDGNGVRYSLDVLRRMAAPAPTVVDLGSARHVAATTATTPAEDRTDVHADASSADERPGDYYNANHGPDALVLLLENGWAIDREEADGALYLTRPGKEDGVSASWGKVAPSVLHVFSSNAHPFEADKSYSAFGVFALLAHNGDYADAARTIRQTMMPVPPSAPTRQGAPIARDAGGRPLDARIVPGHTPAPRFRAMTVAELIAAGADRIPWVVPHLIAPRVITVIAGKGQSGKSLLMLRVGIEIAQHYPVLWYALEAAGEIAGRAAVIEAELRHKHKLPIDTRHFGIVSTQYESGSVVNEPLDVTKPASIEAWGHWIREQGFRVVVIDAWVNLLGNAGLDENSTADASRAVAALDQIMTIADCAVVVIAHSAKAPNGMGDAVRGSSVLTNSARVVIAMSNDDGDVTARTVKANNQKPFNEIRFDITSVEHDGRSGPMINRRVQGRPALTTITGKHLLVLRAVGALDVGDGVTIKDIADALQADMSRQVATPIAKALGDWGYLAVEKKPSGKGSVYRLSTQGRAVVDAAEAGADVAAHTTQNPALAHKEAPTIFTVTPATARQFDGPMGEHADEIDDLTPYSAPMLERVAATSGPSAPAEDRTDGRADDAAQTAPEAPRRAEAPKPTTTTAAPAAPIPSTPAAPDAAAADLFEATTPAAPAPDEEAPMTPTTEARPVAPDTMMPALAPAQLAWHDEGAATIVEYWWRRHATEARTAAASQDRIITIRRGRTPSGREQYLVCDNSCFGLLRGTWLWGYATEDKARAAARALGFTPSPIVSAMAVETANWYEPVP